MRTAVYFDEGKAQLVCTPESDFEKVLLRRLYEKPMTAEVFRGQFYDCQGGWTRWRELGAAGYGVPVDFDASLIINICEVK